MEEDSVFVVCLGVDFSVGELCLLPSFRLLMLMRQGVYTNGAVELGKTMDSAAFRVWSTALLLMLLVLWFMNQIFTVKGIITGRVLGLDRGWRWRYLHEAGNEDGWKEA